MSNSCTIVLENAKFRLEITHECTVKSLVLKSNGEECISSAAELPLFTLTEERPYNNEIKLAHPNKRTTFAANRVRMENGRLIVGFELICFEAVVDVKIAERYMAFTLVDFLVKPDSFGLGVLPILPPVYEFRALQLPVICRERFGEWLNVMWDEKAAVNVLATSPYSRIDSEERRGFRILYGEVMRDVKLKGEGVALIVSEPSELLDAIDTLERDYNLPLGVEKRRSSLINQSYYWSGDVNPENLDRHLEYAKKGGFRYMSIYYTSIFKEEVSYWKNGDYLTYRDEYPHGREDLVKMLEKIKASGIIPGLHILHTHIGLHTKYLTPYADHRINLTKRFTLARPLKADGDTVYVEENPDGSPTYERMRVLKFMGELIQYESYTAEPPYCFVGCKRGFNGTVKREHETGTIGGILDISEFRASSAYIDQRTSLQDEIADAIADVYDAGFEFLYYDGSEGVNPPFEINVALAQWRVYRKLRKKPIFCEGAAKSHFSWHMLNGGNAFDAWKPENFKEMIVAHPFAEAQRMANDFTRLNFGWWTLKDGQRADIFEYGTALAAAHGCPGSFSATLDMLDRYPRIDDILETVRRWEDARAGGFITDEIKEELKKTETEHTLLIDVSGKLELAAWYHVKDAFSGNQTATAFVFERAGKGCAAIWSNRGVDRISLPLGNEKLSYVENFGGDEIPVERCGVELIIEAAAKRYLITELSLEKLTEAIEKSEII